MSVDVTGIVVKVTGRNLHFSPDTIAKNPQLFGQTQKPVVAKPGEARPTKRIRQDSKPLLNKLETRFFEVLKAQYPGVPIRPQAKRYRISSGLSYTPDFTAILHGKEAAWECKGAKVWEDSIVKLKAAAAIWPEIDWWLCWEVNGQWHKQKINP